MGFIVWGRSRAGWRELLLALGRPFAGHFCGGCGALGAGFGFFSFSDVTDMFGAVGWRHCVERGEGNLLGAEGGGEFFGYFWFGIGFHARSLTNFVIRGSYQSTW